MFVATDVTHTGEIAYTEFIAATLAAQQSIEPTVRTAFVCSTSTATASSRRPT